MRRAQTLLLLLLFAIAPAGAQNGQPSIPGGSSPASTATTPGILVSGCVPYTPTDQSGAGLTFTSPTGEYCISGPAGGQIVTVFFSVTYPTTASASNAQISLPLPVPNQAYAVVKGTSGISSTSVNATPRTVINSNPGAITFSPAATNVPTTNVTLTASTLSGSIQYPMQ